jgi:uncharacterized Zn finger protein
MREDHKTEIEDDINEIGDLFTKGLPRSEFWELFVECAQCGHVTPRYLYPYSHRCVKRRRSDSTVTVATSSKPEATSTKTEIQEPISNEVGNSHNSSPRHSRTRDVKSLPAKGGRVSTFKLTERRALD